MRLYAGNPIDEVRGASPQAASVFLNAYATAKTALNDLYQRSMRRTCTNGVNRVAAEFEVDTTAALCGSQITSDMSPLEVIGALNQSFPGLPKILKHKNARDRFITQLEAHSGQTGRFRRTLEIDQALQGLVPVE